MNWNWKINLWVFGKVLFVRQMELLFLAAKIWVKGSGVHIVHHHVAEKWGVVANKGSSLKTDQPEVQLTSAWVGIDVARAKRPEIWNFTWMNRKQMLDAVGVREKQGKTNIKGIFHDKAETLTFGRLYLKCKRWNLRIIIWKWRSKLECLWTKILI